MDFNTLSLKLPGGLSFSLMRYWDGQVSHIITSAQVNGAGAESPRQPVTYVCKSRDSSKEYFFIVFVSSRYPGLYRVMWFKQDHFRCCKLRLQDIIDEAPAAVKAEEEEEETNPDLD
jgi:hypothetical protein